MQTNRITLVIVQSFFFLFTFELSYIQSITSYHKNTFVMAGQTSFYSQIICAE